MTMVTMPSEKNESLGRGTRFAIGLVLFAAYATSLFVSHSFSNIWLWTYLGFLVPILVWSSVRQKAAVLIGFLTGTGLAVAAVAAFILYILTHWGGC